MNLKGYHLHLESFSGNTDANGDLTCTTAQMPLQNGVIAYTNNTKYIVKIPSISGTATKVRFYTIDYDKATQTAKETDNLPSGVSQQTSKQNTAADAGGGLGIGGVNRPTLVHVHGVSFQYQHTHSVTNFTTTDATLTAIGNGVAVNAVLIYASND